MKVKDILEALKGIPEDTEVRVINGEAWTWFAVTGIYFEEGTPVEIEIEMWGNAE